MMVTEDQASRILEGLDKGVFPTFDVSRRDRPNPMEVVSRVMGDVPVGVPSCIDEFLVSYCTFLNAAKWGDKEARAKGQRRLVMASLDTCGEVNQNDVIHEIASAVVSKMVSPLIFTMSESPENASIRESLDEAYQACTLDEAPGSCFKAMRLVPYGSRAREALGHVDQIFNTAVMNPGDAGYHLAMATIAASKAAEGESDLDVDRLAENIEVAVGVLVDLDVPGCKWLPMTEEPAPAVMGM